MCCLIGLLPQKILCEKYKFRPINNIHFKFSFNNLNIFFSVMNEIRKSQVTEHCFISEFNGQPFLEIIVNEVKKDLFM